VLDDHKVPVAGLILVVFGKNSGDGFVGPQFGNFPVTEEVGVMWAGDKDGKGEAGECRQLEMRLEAGATIPRAAIKPAFEKARLRKGHVVGLHGKDSKVPVTRELREHHHRSFSVDRLENNLRKATKERDGDANTKRDFYSFRINGRGGRNLSGHGLKEGKRGIKRALTDADFNLTQCGGWAVQITRNQTRRLRDIIPTSNTTTLTKDTRDTRRNAGKGGKVKWSDVV
jgi:hypothetical protein